MRKCTIFCALAFVFGLANAQEQKQVEYKSYVDSSGTVYWNRNMPLYLHMSSDPSGANNKASLKHSNSGFNVPYYFDTEGANFIRTRWRTNEGKPVVPQEEHLWPVMADGLAPITKIRFEADNKYVIKGKTYFDKSAKFYLTAKDAVSGVESSYVSVNGQPYQVYTEGARLALPVGDNKLLVYSVDKVGNMEKIDDKNSYFSIIVDEAAPTTEYRVEGDNVGNILSPRCKIILTANDDKSGVRITKFGIDRDAAIRYMYPIHTNKLSDGDHSLNFLSVDNVKNAEDQKSYAFYLDAIAPEVSFSIDKDEYLNRYKTRYVSARSSVQFNATDNKAGVKDIDYGFNPVEFNKYIEPINVSNLPNIHNKVYYKAIDKVNNRSAIKYFTFIVDRNAPKVRYKCVGANVERSDTIYLTSDTNIKMWAIDGKGESGTKAVQYKINGDDYANFNGELKLKSDSYHNISIKGIDNVNNHEVKTQYFYVDNTPPEIYYHFSVDKISVEDDVEIYPIKTLIYLAAQDRVVGNDRIFYSINGSRERAYIQPISGLRSGKEYKIKVRALDLLGNESVKEFRFRIR